MEGFERGAFAAVEFVAILSAIVYRQIFWYPDSDKIK